MKNHKRRMPAVGKCFDHLGGRLAPELFKQLLKKGWIQPQQGKKSVFDITEKGKTSLRAVFDIDADQLAKEEE